MGQIITYLRKWLYPNKNFETQSQVHHQTNYQPISVDENQTSHHIDIPDHAFISTTTEHVGNHDNNNLVPSSTPYDIVVDWNNNGCEEVKKKKRRKKKNNNKEKNCQGDQSISSEAVVRESVTSSLSSNQVSTSVKKIGQYSSTQRLLLVGEGDFSFSACLAVAFGNASNITATSLDSEDFLITNYGSFITNKEALVTRGSMVLHDVDATKMLKHPVLGTIVFDCIIFNFPHTGKFGHSETELRGHQKLIRGFLRNAKKMIGEDGEIHITSKSSGFYLEWDIPKIGRDHSLNLIQEIKFKRSKYPGYNTKYGFIGDKNFDCNPSKTYKFKLSR